MASQQVIFGNEINTILNDIIAGMTKMNKLFVLADENTSQLVVPQLELREPYHTITIPAGDTTKDIGTLQQVWTELQQHGATRRSVLINVGGGVVTDLGGFAAATFKRGIRFINCPTTLLSAVDAAVGGKTGINFNGYKNEIGAFCEADAVVISTRFFGTLPQNELKSGFAEMLKHAMLSGDKEFDELTTFDFSNIDHNSFLEKVKTSVEVKRNIVEQDPHEQGLRRALNLGHTVGHAFESLAMQRKKPIAHGFAVAWGLVAETVLSHMKHKFPSAQLHTLAKFVRENYGAYHITCDDYPALLNFMRHDKKSSDGEIDCSLLAACGDIKLDNTICDDDMCAALDIYRDLMHI